MPGVMENGTPAPFATWHAGDDEGGVTGMKKRENAKSMRDRGSHADDPVTGVGHPGAHPEAAGAELGGDTGDVGTPRASIGGASGGTYGVSAMPDSSAMTTPNDHPTLRKRRKAA